MLRKTLIALIGAFTLGSASAAIAQQLDGDANPIPGVYVNRPAADLERSFAGPRGAARTVSAQEAARMARLSEVH